MLQYFKCLLLVFSKMDIRCFMIKSLKTNLQQKYRIVPYILFLIQLIHICGELGQVSCCILTNKNLQNINCQTLKQQLCVCFDRQLCEVNGQLCIQLDVRQCECQLETLVIGDSQIMILSINLSKIYLLLITVAFSTSKLLSQRF